MSAEAGSPEDGPRDAFVLQTEYGFDAFALSGTRVFETRDDSIAFHPLQLGRRGLLWERVSDDTFEIETLDEPFLTLLFETVYLTDGAVPEVGTRWERSLFDVEVVARDEEGVRRMRVRCSQSLDDPSVLFLVPEEGILRRVAPPEPGETVELSAPIPANPLIP